MFRIVGDHSVTEDEAMAIDFSEELLLAFPREGLAGKAESIADGATQQATDDAAAFVAGFT